MFSRDDALSKYDSAIIAGNTFHCVLFFIIKRVSCNF